MRSALVFTPDDFTQLSKIVALGRELCPDATSTYALVCYSGEPLGVLKCHKLWVQMFLKAGDNCPGYPKRITYSLFRAQVWTFKAYSYTKTAYTFSI